MLLRVVILFLVAMAAIALVGRWIRPGGRGRTGRLPPPATCRRCGRPVSGTGPCACGAPRG